MDEQTVVFSGPERERLAGMLLEDAARHRFAAGMLLTTPTEQLLYMSSAELLERLAKTFTGEPGVPEEDSDDEIRRHPLMRQASLLLTSATCPAESLEAVYGDLAVLVDAVLDGAKNRRLVGLKQAVGQMERARIVLSKMAEVRAAIEDRGKPSTAAKGARRRPGAVESKGDEGGSV